MTDSNWPATVPKAEDGQIDSFELPDMTEGAKDLIAEHEISDENVLKIETSGANGKLQKLDVEKYIDSLLDDSDPVDPDEVLPTLVFANHGWCDKLKRSYCAGRYKPKTKAEYEALKKYAK